MFPCSHTLSECFRTVIFRNFVPCSQKLANVPLFPSIFCQCSLVPQNPWETLAILRFYPGETQHDRPSFAVNESVPKSRPCWAALVSYPDLPRPSRWEGLVKFEFWYRYTGLPIIPCSPCRMAAGLVLMNFRRLLSRENNKHLHLNQGKGKGH